MDKQERFITSVKENEHLIFKIASVYTNNIHDKKDLVQDIIYQLWKSYDTYDQRAAIGTWMYRVALNVAIYQIKISKKRIATVPLEDGLVNFSEAGSNNIEDRWDIFRNQIGELNLLDKAIVMLYLDNKSYEEIAEIIGITATNVGTKFSRIKDKLKKRISKLS